MASVTASGTSSCRVAYQSRNASSTWPALNGDEACAGVRGSGEVAGTAPEPVVRLTMSSRHTSDPDEVTAQLADLAVVLIPASSTPPGCQPRLGLQMSGCWSYQVVAQLVLDDH